MWTELNHRALLLALITAHPLGAAYAGPETAYAAPRPKDPAAARSSAVASPSDPKTVFILPLKVVGDAPPALGSQVAAWIADELTPQKAAFPIVSTQKDLDLLLDAEASRRLVDCRDDDECLARIRERTRADLLVFGTVGRVGRELIATLTVLDAETSTPLNRVGATASSSDALHRRIPELVAQLVGYGRPARETFALPYRDNLRLGIFAIEAVGVAPNTVKNLTQLLAVELAQVRGADVISPEDIEATIGKQRFDEIVTGECDDECLARLSGALNVDYIVVGQIGQLDTSYVVSLRLIDQRVVRVANRVTETFHGPEEELKRAIRSVGRAVVGIDAQGSGTIAVSGPVSGAAVTIGDQVIGETPLNLAQPFPAGRLAVRIVKDGYLDWQSDVFVQPGETNLVWAELQEEPGTIFERWWFWAIVSGVVATGAVVGWQLSQQSPENVSGGVGVGAAQIP